MALNPLSQFTIHEVYSTELFGQTIQFTNQALSMIVAIGGVMLIFFLGARKQEMVPGRLQSFVEFTYEFIHNTVKENAGSAGLKFLPLIMTLFLYIAGLNLFGLIPNTFTATSQFALNGVMAFSVFGFVLLVGFWKHGLKFLKIFWPPETPFFLALFIAPLEMISFFARPFTLAIRLTANMLAGHILVKVFASFIIMLGVAAGFADGSTVGVIGGIISGFFPLAALMVISCLELLVALLQAYVFAVLTCVYLNDALHLH